MAILDEIGDLKDMVQDTVTVPQDETRQPGMDLFLLQVYPATKLDIIASIPPRIVVDSIIAKYFKWADMPAALIVHRGVFLKQYEIFWAEPLATSTMWLTILFGMLYIVAYCTLFINGALETLDEETIGIYQDIILTSRERMIQCLRLGNYMKGSPHTIEALLVFLQAEYLQAKDTQQGCWQLTGVIVRVALKMGYHRDGSHFSDLSAYEAEMRHRTWYILTQFDIASASLVGLPRIIKEAQCDTAEPLNLRDEDFDDTSAILPSARPYNDHTLSQFLVYKSRVVSVYGMICDFTTSSKQRDHDEAIRLDTLLRKSYTQKPAILEMKAMQLSTLDGMELTTRRLYIAMSYHHAQITLHRKFMILAKTNSKYSYSYTICIDAAMAVMRLQNDLFEQCQPGRMLHADRWKILSLIQSEFLLATTVLCFNMDDDVKKRLSGQSTPADHEMMRKTIDALKNSRNMWEQQQGLSNEAQTAVKAINMILAKVESTIQPENQWVVSLGYPAAAPKSASSSVVSASTTVAAAVRPKSIPDFVSTSAQVSPPLEQQVNFDDVAFSEFFDMDQSWDEWLEL